MGPEDCASGEVEAVDVVYVSVDFLHDFELGQNRVQCVYLMYATYS